MAALSALGCPLGTNSQPETGKEDRDVNFGLYVPNVHKSLQLENSISVSIIACHQDFGG